MTAREPLMTGPRPFQSANGPVKAPPIPTEEEYRMQQRAKREAIERRWALERLAKARAVVTAWWETQDGEWLHFDEIRNDPALKLRLPLLNLFAFHCELARLEEAEEAERAIK